MSLYYRAATVRESVGMGLEFVGVTAAVALAASLPW